jgi:hypothetical protein
MRGCVCRLQLLPALASVVILRSESRGTHDHILLSQIRDSPQLGGPGPCIYTPQEDNGPVIPPGTGFHFRRLLRLTGIRWRHSTTPPYGVELSVILGFSLCSFVADSRENAVSIVIALQYLLDCSLLIRCRGTCLPSRCLVMNIYYGSVVSAFRSYVKI